MWSNSGFFVGWHVRLPRQHTTIAPQKTNSCPFYVSFYSIAHTVGWVDTATMIFTIDIWERDIFWLEFLNNANEQKLSCRQVIRQHVQACEGVELLADVDVWMGAENVGRGRGCCIEKGLVLISGPRSRADPALCTSCVRCPDCS
jgi:hypothetical protein